MTMEPNTTITRHCAPDIRLALLLLIVLISSCQPVDDQGHSHAGDNGHSHDNEDQPTEVHTIWTDSTELFVEFPALVVGQVSMIAAHFTVLDGHRPVESGSVTVSLIIGNKGIRQSVDAPSSPGIFTPSLQPTDAGTGRLIFELTTLSMSDSIVISNVQVYPSGEEARQELGTDDTELGNITFLKEQAWKMEFQTSRIGVGEVHDVIRTSGVWKKAPSDHRKVVATNDGIVTFVHQKLTPGGSVRQGQVLATVSSAELTSDNLNAEIEKARAQFEQAKSEYERKKELHDLKIVPTAEFDRVKERYEVARTTYETLQAGYSPQGKQVIAPSSGYIRTVAVDNGGFVRQGDVLLTITNRRTSLLEVRISPSYVTGLQNIRDIWYQIAPGSWSSLSMSGGSILSIGREVGKDRPLIPVFAEVNEAVTMPEGSFTEVQVAIGLPVVRPVVPVTALMEDYGNYSVIVQVGGQEFERRNITIGRRNGDIAEVVDGLSAGEIIVTKGAYQVRMASMSGQAPAHGHTH